MRDPTTILLPKDHAPERKESFYAKIKVSTFVNFEVGRFKKKKKKKIMKNSKRRCGSIPYVIISVYFEGLVW